MLCVAGHGRPPQCVLLLQDKVTAAGKKVRMNPAAGFMGTLQSHSGWAFEDHTTEITRFAGGGTAPTMYRRSATVLRSRRSEQRQIGQGNRIRIDPAACTWQW